MPSDAQESYSSSISFTETYKRHASSHPTLREARCLEAFLPGVFRPIEAGDRLAGRVAYPPIGFSPEPGGFGYYCREDELRSLARDLGDEARSRAEEAIAFWRNESTQSKCRAAYPPALAEALPSDAWTVDSGVAFPLYRMAGLTPDFGELLASGLPGLRNRIENGAALSRSPEFRGGMLAALALMDRISLRYAIEADSAGMSALAAGLRSIPVRPPETLLEAMQLFWLYALCSGSWNYGRMDVYLGPFLARDLDSGRLAEEEALELLCSLWRLIQAYDNQFNNRVYIGGKGRANEAEADRFALLALEATRIVGGSQPQLSLRFYGAQDRRLMDRALGLLAEGRTFPILYNDEAYVPAVAAALGVSIEEAEDYSPFGCGECVLPHRSAATPSGVINLLKALEVSLHGGKDPLTGLAWGAPAPSDFASFEELWDDYAARVERFVGALAEQERIEYEVAGSEAAFLFLSALYDDCVGRGLPLLSGGVRYLGGTIESYGDTNAADSLIAIRKLVFEEKRLSLSELVGACDGDFAGREDLRRLLLEAPKYGND
ncbi:MAG: pyruvate formate lyase family protein, partial [Spirochaetaceae bacterium]|nr:pyruvate formate lyase family protein [Spirochaetaceae bacterium]